MRTYLRYFLALAIPLSILAACGTDRESESPVDTSLELAGVAAECPAGDIAADIEALFPTKKSLRHVATVNCGQIYKDLGKGKQTQSIQKAFRFFEKTLQQNEADQLLDPDPSAEVVIIHLFAAILTDLGFDFPDIDPEVLAAGEFAFGTLTPGGDSVLTLSKHAGIDDGGGLFGPVQVVIFQIPPAENGGLELASESHPCPAGVDNTFDCYPLFFDYSVVPESNVNPAVGLQLGQCNVSPPDVEVLLLSPEGFLPEDDAPTGIDCTDVEPEVAMTGWRSYAWAVLEPISPLFRVSKAFAGKSPIGGRISAFSPVAPADPESGGEEPNLNETETSLTPEGAISSSGQVESFTATVTEAVSGDPVNSGTVRFTVTGIEFNDEFEGAVEGSASMNLGCSTDGAGDIDLPPGDYTIDAEYLGTEVFGPSSDPESSTWSCSFAD